MANLENKIHILGKEFAPEDVALGGIILIVGGVLARFKPSIATAAILAGVGMMVYGTHKMEKQPPDSRTL